MSAAGDFLMYACEKPGPLDWFEASLNSATPYTHSDALRDRILACLNRVGDWDKCVAVLSSSQHLEKEVRNCSLF